MVRLRTTYFSAQPLEQTASVTVVIPCFNYEQYLSHAVRSALSQQGVDVDVIVVDDASTDESLGVARAIASGDPRVTVIANEKNSGPVETFNRGLDAATGEFLVRLDADDLLTPGSLARAIAPMRAFPAVGLVYGHPIHFSGDELPKPRTLPKRWSVWAGDEWLAVRCMDGTNVITSPEVVMRRSVVDVVGGQRPLAHTHDMEMWLRISAHADVAYVGGVDQAWHREHTRSLSRKAEDPIVILGEIRDAFDLLFEGLGSSYPNAAELHQNARRAVARQAWAYAGTAFDRGRITPEAERLVEFATECDATLVVPASYQALRSGGGASWRRMFGILSRARRRCRGSLRSWRWHRSGVYEPLRVVSAVDYRGVAA